MNWTAARLGYAAIKGTRHRARSEVLLDRDGAVGDRAFCLVDPERGVSLRTVQNPSLVAVDAEWAEPYLCCRFPDGAVVEAEAQLTDHKINFDYWGRVATGRLVNGPWAEHFSDYLGRRVVLVRCQPGQVVFGDAVTLITRSSLAGLGSLVGDAEPARLRATAVIDDQQSASGPLRGVDLGQPNEGSWIGQQLELGAARIQITAPVARCAVIDLNPITGERDSRLLSTLGRTARRDETFDDPIFGVQGIVTRPGAVRVGDPVTLSAR